MVVVVVIDIDVESNSHQSLCHATHIHTPRTKFNIGIPCSKMCRLHQYDLFLCYILSPSTGIKINYQKNRIKFNFGCSVEIICFNCFTRFDRKHTILTFLHLSTMHRNTFYSYWVSFKIKLGLISLS